MIRGRARNLAGFDAGLCPRAGTAHGMPIEIQIEKQFGKSLPARRKVMEKSAHPTRSAARSKSRSSGFRRLGVLGDWDNPVQDDEFHGNEAGEIRALGKIPREGLRVSRTESR